MGMEYKKIHSCPNDCIFYRNEYEDLRRYPRLKTMCIKINRGQKVTLTIDVNTGVSGPNSENFSSYLEVVASKRISILSPS